MFLAQKFAPPTHLAPPTHPKKKSSERRFYRRGGISWVQQEFWSAFSFKLQPSPLNITRRSFNQTVQQQQQQQ